ncbi:MAG: phosphatase domain-containing protein [Myxococcaceae bacterium]|nr:phosphatase domain-containing protein [Myxococcaceae bacterium]
MTVKLSANADAASIASAWRKEVLEPAAKALAGRDGRLSASEVTRLSRLTGLAALAKDNVADVFDLAKKPGAKSVSVSAFLAAGEAMVAAEVTAVAGADGTLSRAEFQALSKLQADFSFGGGATVEWGVVSDLDKTIIPPEENGAHPNPYPGVSALLRELEFGSGGAAGDVTFVTARSPDRVTDVPDYLETHGVPGGPIETGVGTSPFVAQREKVADIVKVLEANPGQRFVFLGDSSHRDPEVYREVQRRFPDRVAAVIIHQVTQTVNPARVEGQTLVENYAVAAASLSRAGVLDKAAAKRVIDSARAEGLALTTAEARALLA